MPRQPLNVVVLGGSFAGLSVAHRFLDNIIHQLSTFEGAPTYRVVLISPSTHLYWNICAPRALVSPKLIHTEDAFTPIEPAFSRHPFDEFTFMQGWATGVDTSARKIQIELVKNDSSTRSSGMSKASSSSAAPESPTVPTIRDTDYCSNAADRHSKVQTIPYHALVIATGSSAHSPLYSLHGTHEETLAELRDFHRRLESAHSVMVVGGGPSGVETAGQLATFYNRCQRWRKFKAETLQPSSSIDPQALERAYQVLFPSTNKRTATPYEPDPTPSTPRERNKHDSGVSAQSSSTPPIIYVTRPAPEPRIPKTITLLSGGNRILSNLSPTVSKKAEKQLRKLGVHVVHNLRELSNTTNIDGSSSCILNNDMTITSDLLVSATGVYPNTRFLPKNMLDESGYVITDREILRVYGQGIGDRVYAVGDCSAYSKNCLLDVYDAIPFLMKNLHNDLLAHEYKLQTVTSVRGPDVFARIVSWPLPHARHENREKSETLSKVVSSPPGEQSQPPSREGETERAPSPTLPISPMEMRPRLSFPAPAPARFSLKLGPSLSSPLENRTPLLTPQEARTKIEALEDARFKQNPTDTVLMPTKRFGGVGVVFNFRLPSFMVYLIKGRSYKVGKVRDVVGDGRNPFGIM